MSKFKKRARALASPRKIAADRLLKSSGESTTAETFGVQHIALDAIQVSGARRPLKEGKLRAMQGSILQLGVRTPITVRPGKKNKFVLVAGEYRLVASQMAGLEKIPCFVMTGDKVDALVWQIAENMRRADLTALDRAELVDELRMRIRRQKVGQLAPRGGRQPKYNGIKDTARFLGLTKEEVRRCKDIARISSEAKAAARARQLDDNQQALLRIANAQLASVHAFDGGMVSIDRTPIDPIEDELEPSSAAAKKANKAGKSKGLSKSGGLDQQEIGSKGNATGSACVAITSPSTVAGGMLDAPLATECDLTRNEDNDERH